MRPFRRTLKPKTTRAIAGQVPAATRPSSDRERAEEFVRRALAGYPGSGVTVVEAAEMLAEQTGIRLTSHQVFALWMGLPVNGRS